LNIELLGFFLFAYSQVGTPGPANLTLLAVGAKYGLKKSIPFVLGVALGKQIIIWPIGFGLMTIASSIPFLFLMLKWLSICYIIWLAYKIANLRLISNKQDTKSPNFITGFFIHPLNPKAWAMVITSFSSFASSDEEVLITTAMIATGFLICQLTLHPLWCFGGEKLATKISGKTQERYLMLSLAGLTVLSVFFGAIK